MSKLTARKLKEELWEFLEGIKAGSKSIEEAIAVSAVAREIIRTTNTQIKISAVSSRPLSPEVLNFAESSE